MVVGGVAAQIHGWRGATADLDIAVSTEDSNVERPNVALASVGAGSGTIGAFGTAFVTKHGRLEIVRRAMRSVTTPTGFAEHASIGSATD